ncbi:class I adenylate-forming enzyme family protein [Novosphingobium sp. NDB2Meth1]|uniref:class I adenylate-forming enzyme family protein n=1 Tax=Novosphingobium sp. NDB2Meth1 TaxID=1892847 RepID=UPI000930CBE3|nr:AMP-binding protein [Novosphingobium sp. NDB2Meth1]
MDTLFGMALDWARRDGGREALVDGPLRLTYAQLAERITALAEVLSQHGLRAGDRVAFLGAPGAAFLISELATHKAGGVWLGLNPRYTARELLHVVADSRPALIVAEGANDLTALHSALDEVADRPSVQVIASVDDLPQVPQLCASAPLLDPRIALLVYTSGTTGVPKGAMLTHEGTVAAARLYAARYGHEGLRTLLNLPINHVGALIDLVSPALACGGTLVTMPTFDPAAIPAVLEAERISILGQVPAMHLAIDAAGGYNLARLPHLRHLVWSGAAMPRSWIEARMSAPVELSTCYGQTECTGSITFTRPGASVEELADTVGAPAEPGDLRVVLSDGSAAPSGEVGEIQLRGPLLMAGYAGLDAATRETITPEGWLRTGDLGCLDEEGRLRLVGRLKEMYKSGGHNVYPREVETVLEEHPAVAAAAVIAMPDTRWQEVGWAFIIARAEVTADEILAHARERLANYKVPKQIVVRPELPMLPIGKIDKRALRQAAEQGLYA